MIERKASWRFAALAALPHDCVGGLQIAREPLGIEQRMRLQIARELCFEGAERRGLARECERGFFIGLKRWGHEFRHSDRMQQAGSDARREGGTLHRRL